jgi:hypothetical protein
VLWHVTRKRKRRVVSLINRKAPAKPRDIVLASRDLARDGHQLVELYGARLQIEFLFRDSQQCTGLTDGQARAEAARSFHCKAALATLTLVHAEERNAQVGEAPQVCSMASGQQRKFNARLLELLREK